MAAMANMHDVTAAIYSQYVKNVSFGYTEVTQERIFNESVLIQTLPEALTVGPILHYGLCSA